MNTELMGVWTQKWMLRPVTNCCRGSSIVRVAPALSIQGHKLMKIRKSKLTKIIKEEILKEYYRGFVQDVQDLGFVSLYDAALSMTTVPESVDILGTNDAKKIAGASSDSYGLSYVLDKWKEDNPGKTADDVFPKMKNARQKYREKQKQKQKEPGDSAPSTDVPTPEETTGPTEPGKGLKDVVPKDLKSGLTLLRNTGLKMNSKDFLQRILDRFDDPTLRVPPAALQVASKAAGEIAKIINGDLSNLKESKGDKNE